MAVVWYRCGKFHYSLADGKSFPSLSDFSRSIHRWNTDKRADEPMRALIVESGNSLRKKQDFYRRICKNRRDLFIPS